MENYNRFMAEGSIVRFTEMKTFNKGTEFERTCLLIHHTDNSMPSDCSPHRILEVVVSHSDGWNGTTVNSYKDSFCEQA